MQTARHTSVDFGELELHCLRGKPRPPIWKEGQRDRRMGMPCWGRWEWLADFCELRSSKSPERTLPTCKGASCNQVLETDVEILGDDGASLQSICPTCAHHVLSCGDTVNISPQSVFVEWIKKLTFLSGDSLFLKTDASALPKFGGKYGLVTVRGKSYVYRSLTSLCHSRPVLDQEDSQIDGPFGPKILEFNDVVSCIRPLSGVLKSSLQGEINPDKRKDWHFE